MKFEKQYKIEQGPPVIPWSEYEGLVFSNWTNLLNNAAELKECDFQNFLEHHPCMVPGAQSMITTSGHAAFNYSLISQPLLPGFSPKKPDFLWVAKDSLHCHPTLIEIEHPSKRWFRADGVPHSDLTAAQSQLADWKQWFSKDSNRIAFIDQYCPSARDLVLKPHFVLIYGRQSEFHQKPTLNTKRASLPRESETYMTFDRLHPDERFRHYFSSKLVGEYFEAIHAPATLEIGPFNANNFAHLKKKEEAISKADFLSKERKAFLVERIKYWDKLANENLLAYYHSSDRE